MRLNLASDEMGVVGTAPRVADGDPLPPEDRVPHRASDYSIEALYRAQMPRLLRFFTRRSGNDDALDLVHETFERLARRDDDPGSTVDRPEAYLTRIAGNLLRDRAKFAARRSAAFHVSIDEVPLAGRDPHDQLEARDMINRLETAMQRLRPRTREIFMACRLDGYSYAEVAERVGMSVRGVRKQMSRAIAEIDRVLSDD
ncbi:RNA polymerase sigma factor [Sphingomonas psychrolutea]|uniref:DNA-directed RNA polymerase sigma-70 factor n=1 Tax=Sphingomonas psychrolutea TaxID=1259676 RepID=A0ABQ1H6K5_9SPHN|nr:sigma-70 family RNA polymerase sigma factor [Sphingomonas psychrolutea]GGA59071.1 DNA-directed RNA polymerase sigma-70 factor [Sphingomonas psychrolutea]